jgi:hypothetical protein
LSRKWTSVSPCVTDDGYFSIDVYMPDINAALEFDGPSHFINIAAGGEGAAPGDASRTPTRTVRTELRDLFLQKRHAVGRCRLRVWQYENLR